LNLHLEMQSFIILFANLQIHTKKKLLTKVDTLGLDESDIDLLIAGGLAQAVDVYKLRKYDSQDHYY